MPIVKCPSCGKPSRITNAELPVACSQCGKEVSLANPGSPQNSVPSPTSNPSEPTPSTSRQNSSELLEPSITREKGFDVATLLPPKFVSENFLARMLPPKSEIPGGNFFGIGQRNKRGTILLPDGIGGFQEVGEQVVHLTQNGERVPIVLRDRRSQLRRRAIFNLIAMLICLAILYASFLLMVPSK